MVHAGTTIHHRENWGVYADVEEHGDSEDDARLIAAAPELLEACMQHVFAVESRDTIEAGNALANMRAAIAAATGDDA